MCPLLSFVRRTRIYIKQPFINIQIRATLQVQLFSCVYNLKLYLLRSAFFPLFCLDCCNSCVRVQEVAIGGNVSSTLHFLFILSFVQYQERPKQECKWMQILHCLWEKRGRNTSNIEIEFEKSFSKARFQETGYSSVSCKEGKKKSVCAREVWSKFGRVPGWPQRWQFMWKVPNLGGKF